MTDQEHPEDKRPRPKYGELAPQGWTWVPPEDAANPDGVHPTAQQKHGHPQQHHAQQQRPQQQTPPQQVQRERTRAPLWNRNLTIVLLFVGLIGTIMSIGVMNALPQSLQLIYDQDKLGTYTPADSVPALILASSICQAVLWVASVVIALLVLRRGRYAFYVPIVAGVTAAIVLFAFIGVIVTHDQTLLNYYSS